MKGIIFNLLQEVVQLHHGPAVWDDLLEEAKVEGAFTSLGSYPDAHLLGLVSAASKRLTLTPQEVVRWFGVSGLPLLAKKYPHFFAGHTDARSFLLTLNVIIHPEVRKLYPGADCPMFDFSASSEDVLMMSYRSQRSLCAMAEGFIDGSAAYFKQTVSQTQTSCALRGDDCCVFRIEFGSTAS